MKWERMNHGQEHLYDDHVPLQRLLAVLANAEVVIYDDGYNIVRRQAFATTAEARAWAEMESQWTALDRLR